MSRKVKVEIVRLHPKKDKALIKRITRRAATYACLCGVTLQAAMERYTNISTLDTVSGTAELIQFELPRGRAQHKQMIRSAMPPGRTERQMDSKRRKAT